MERGSRKRSSSAGSEKMERVGGRWEKMEGHCSTGQSPQWAVVPMEEEEEEEEKKKKKKKKNWFFSHWRQGVKKSHKFPILFFTFYRQYYRKHFTH